MNPGRPVQKASRVAALALVLCLSSGTYSWGQIEPLDGQGQGAAPLGGFALGGWLLYPRIFMGGGYDTNPNQSPTGATSGLGGRFVPSFRAETGDGIHQSSLYGMMDARGYTETGASGTLAANAGFIQRYQPIEDLTVTAMFDYTRQKDLFSTFGIDHSVTNFNPTGVGLPPEVNPQTYDQYAGVLSVHKDFDRLFVDLRGSVVDIIYEKASPGTQSPNGVTYFGGGRGGYWFTPWLNAYIDVSMDQRRWAISAFDSHGLRALAGIGTDQIGLLRGEIFGGYQEERYDSQLGAVSGAVLGGRLNYSPLPELKISASVDEKLGVSQQASSSSGCCACSCSATPSIGCSTRVITSLITADYSFASDWVASARFGYIRTTYVGTTRLDNAWTSGGTVTYSLWRNFGLTLDYQHTELQSTTPLQGFMRDVLTVGVTYNY